MRIYYEDENLIDAKTNCKTIGGDDDWIYYPCTFPRVKQSS